MNLIAATVGITRIQNFLDSEEMAGVTHLNSSSSSSKAPSQHISKPSSRSGSDLQTLDDARLAAVQINRSSFAWDGDGTESSAVLHDVQLEVPQGSLVIIVGPVGSGKSSLLNAVLGEMIPVGSSSSSGSSLVGSRSPVSVAGSVAYTAQVGSCIVEQRSVLRRLALCPV